MSPWRRSILGKRLYERQKGKAIVKLCSMNLELFPESCCILCWMWVSWVCKRIPARTVVAHWFLWAFLRVARDAWLTRGAEECLQVREHLESRHARLGHAASRPDALFATGVSLITERTPGIVFCSIFFAPRFCFSFFSFSLPSLKPPPLILLLFHRTERSRNTCGNTVNYSLISLLNIFTRVNIILWNNYLYFILTFFSRSCNKLQYVYNICCLTIISIV